MEVEPGKAAIVYSIPAPDEKLSGRGSVRRQVVLNGSTLSIMHVAGPRKTELRTSGGRSHCRGGSVCPGRLHRHSPACPLEGKLAKVTVIAVRDGYDAVLCP